MELLPIIQFSKNRRLISYDELKMYINIEGNTRSWKNHRIDKNETDFLRLKFKACSKEDMEPFMDVIPWEPLVDKAVCIENKDEIEFQYNNSK